MSAFKVLCVDDKLAGECMAGFLVKEGETYNVINTFEGGRAGWWWYELEMQPGVGYVVERFIPLSDISETNFVREYNTEKV